MGKINYSSSHGGCMPMELNAEVDAKSYAIKFDKQMFALHSLPKYA